MYSDDNFSNTDVKFNSTNQFSLRYKFEDMSNEIQQLTSLLAEHKKYNYSLQDIIIQKNLDIDFIKREYDYIYDKLNVYKKFIEMNNNIKINDP